MTLRCFSRLAHQVADTHGAAEVLADDFCARAHRKHCDMLRLGFSWQLRKHVQSIPPHETVGQCVHEAAGPIHRAGGRNVVGEGGCCLRCKCAVWDLS